MGCRTTDKTSKARKRGAREKIALVGFLAVVSAGFETPARASNFITNGTFTSTTGTFAAAGGGIVTDSGWTTGGSLSSWSVVDVSSSSGLVFLYTDGNQGSTATNGEGISLTGRFGGFSLYDPGNVAGTTPSGGAIPNTSPGGGNFIVADGASGYDVAIYQSLTGLTSGEVYAVSFWYAAGQQYSFTGTTTEGWQVSLESGAQTTQVTANGTTIQDTPTQAGSGLASGSFQAWAQETFYFTASGTSQVLTFLSMGTPSGQPPAVLLSDVTMDSTTPEPASVTFFAIGMASLIGLLWYRRNRDRKATGSSPGNQ
jgi:hypothetical protein